jgi:osmoprotectant transport system permease protein
VAGDTVVARTEDRHVSNLINFFVDNPGLLARKALETIALASVAVFIAIVLALPLGIYLGHKHRGSLLAINVSNVLRALPSLALIAIALAFFGLSKIDITIALVALALPPILTNAYTAVDHVDADAVEAARGMGMTERQVLTWVELPLSWPLIFAGIRTATVYVIATTPLAGIAGGGGYGDIILNQPTYHLVGVIAATILIVVLAFAADAVMTWVQRRVTPRGLRVDKQLSTIVPPTESDVPAERALSVNT